MRTQNMQLFLFPLLLSAACSPTPENTLQKLTSGETFLPFIQYDDDGKGKAQLNLTIPFILPCCVCSGECGLLHSCNEEAPKWTDGDQLISPISNEDSGLTLYLGRQIGFDTGSESSTPIRRRWEADSGELYIQLEPPCKTIDITLHNIHFALHEDYHGKDGMVAEYKLPTVKVDEI